MGTTKYTITEFADMLRIQVTVVFSVRERLLTAGIIGLIFAGFAYQSSTRGWALAVAFLATVLVFFGSKTKRSTVDVTKLELSTSGTGGGRGGRRARTVFTANVSQLKFQSASYLRGAKEGLYADTASTPILILPYVDSKQVTEIIHAIERKFPVLAQRWYANQQIE